MWGRGGTLASGVKEEDSMGFSLYGEFLDLHIITLVTCLSAFAVGEARDR